MSGYWPATDQPDSQIEQPPLWAGQPSGFLDNMAADAMATMHTDNEIGMTSDYENAYADRVQQIYSLTGQKLENPVTAALEAQGPIGRVFDGGGLQSSTAILDGKISDFEKQADGLRTQYPQLATEQQMLSGLATQAQMYQGIQADVNNRATWTDKVGGSLVGGAGASMVSTPNLLSMSLAAPAGAGLMRSAITNAAIFGAAQGVDEPMIQHLREKFGLGGSFKQGAEDVGETALGAGLITGAGHALGHALGSDAAASAAAASADALKNGQNYLGSLMGNKLVNLFDNVVKNPTPDQTLARDMTAHIADINSTSPLDNSVPGAIEEHNDRLTQAMTSLQTDQPLTMPETPAAPLSQATLTTPPGQLDGIMNSFSPADIQTDAKTFQFKEGGDDAGVTDRLQGVQDWDPVKAGMVIVYENNDGDQFIADGHQCLGLAQRIAADNPNANIKLYGPLFREADGYTPESVRVIAAMKNIAEGTGTAVDAAKVLRVDPSRMAELPRASQLVRQAGDMVNLTDNGFGMVINDLVPANQAAIVGRLVKEPALSDAIMNVLAKVEPENAAQAEAVVRQAMEAGTHTETQQSLFGEEAVTSSLYLERAKVMDKALKKLKTESKVFQTLTDNAARIENEGNVLNSAANAARAETDGRAAQMIQTLANRKGPLSDALTVAARRAADEGRYANATGDFVTAVRSAIDRGDFNGLEAGANGRAPEVTNEIQSRARHDAEAAPENQNLKLFDEPGGEGSRDQARALEADINREAGIDKTAQGDQRVIPGAEQKSLQDVADQTASQKIKPTAEQQAANEGLFDVAGRGQGDLLDQPVAIGERIDENGNVVSETKTVGQLLEEMDQDAKDLEAIGKCGMP